MRRSAAVLLASCTMLAASTMVAEPAESATADPDGTYTMIGSGFGHGVGMSQYGAKGMADQGASASSILSKYYRGTAISSRDEPTLRVWMADGPGGVAVSPSGPVAVTNDAGSQATSIAAPATVQVEGGGLTLRQGSNLLLGPVAGPLVVRFDPGLDAVPGAVVRVDPSGRRFRFGRLELSNVGGTTVRAVLRDLAMDRYLHGLGEVPSSWPLEAQRAQAIAARTYAIEKVNRLGQFRFGCSCGLFSTTADQNYVGYDKEIEPTFPNWRNAVDSTSRRVVTFNGNIIEAFYHSSSGGYTENSENVFSAALPYLKGAPDPDDERASPYNGWKRSYLGTDLQRWLNAQGDTAIGTLASIEALSPYGVSGRVTKVVDGAGGGVRIIGSAGVKRVSGDRFRTVVNAGLAAEGRSTEQLRSTLFQFGWEPYTHGFRGGVFAAGGNDSGAGEVLVTGADAGGGPHVVVTNRFGRPLNGFFAYAPRFTGGVRVAVCDLDGDGTVEVVTGAGSGGGPHVRSFRLDGAAVGGFFAYDVRFAGGVYVACGDVDGIPGNEIVTGAGAGGGPHVRVFKPDGTPVGGFFAYAPAFAGGVRVATGDLDGSSGQEIVTGAGPGGGPHVRLLHLDGSELANFFAYSPAFTGGVYVATVLTPGATSVLTGAGEGGGSHVRILRPDGSSLYDQIVFGGVMANGVRPASLGPSSFAAGGPGAWPLVRPLP